MSKTQILGTCTTPYNDNEIKVLRRLVNEVNTGVLPVKGFESRYNSLHPDRKRSFAGLLNKIEDLRKNKGAFGAPITDNYRTLLQFLDREANKQQRANLLAVRKTKRQNRVKAMAIVDAPSFEFLDEKTTTVQTKLADPKALLAAVLSSDMDAEHKIALIAGISFE